MVEREDVDSSSDDEEGLPNGWERRVVRGRGLHFNYMYMYMYL